MDIPLVTPIVSRNGLPLTDSYILNGYVQSNKKVAKRPGLLIQHGFGAGVGQGMFTMKGISYAIIGDVIYNVNSPYTAYTIPTITTANLQYQFVSNPPYLSTALTVLKTTAGMWTFNGTTVTKVTSANYPATTITGIAFLDGTYYVETPSGQIFGSAIADPTTWTALNVLTVNSLQGSSVAIYSNNVQVVCFGSQWTTQYYDNNNPPPGSPLAQNFSGSHAVGCASSSSIVQISEYVVFMAQNDNGRSIQILSNDQLIPISDEDINRILDNDSLATVYSFSIDIAGKMFYLLTLINTSITLVYDFSNKIWTYWANGAVGTAYPVQLTLGSDLFTVTGILVNHGYVNGDSIKITGATLSAFNGNWSITVIDSNTFTFILSFLGQIVNENGVYLIDQLGNYVVANTPPSSGVVGGAILSSKYSTTYLSVMSSTGSNYVLDISDGNVYQLNTTTYTDADGLIDFQIVTPEIMAKDTELRRIGAIEIRGDKIATTGYIRYSDDGNLTWSTYQPINMAATRAKTVRCGATRRRAYQFRNVDNTSLRVQDLIIDVDWVDGGK